MFEDIDYHIHTCYSDGDLTPEEIVDRYLSNGYSKIAITDHDGIEGSMVAFWHSAGKDISVIPGVELSTKDSHGNTIHVLGYNFDYSNKELCSTLSQISLYRARRNDRLLELLNEMGYNITIDDLLSVNEGRFIGKPTFAKVLMKMGVVESVSDAFDGIFSDERIRSLEKKTLEAKEAIDLIHHANGAAVLAHPMEIKRTSETKEAFYSRVTGIIEELIEAGIDGIECYHPSANAEDSEFFRDKAKAYNLCVTKGSDFHSDATRRNYEG